MSKSPVLRPAETTDTSALIAIMEPVIRTTTASFSTYERDAGEWADFITSRRAAGRETYVAEIDGVVVGYSSYDQFRANNGYRHAMEHSVYLAPAAQGAGIGRMLMKAVEDHARAAGANTMFGAIDAENVASLAFHEKLGYFKAAQLNNVARKFDRWLNLVLMQKML